MAISQNGLNQLIQPIKIFSDNTNNIVKKNNLRFCQEQFSDEEHCSIFKQPKNKEEITHYKSEQQNVCEKSYIHLDFVKNSTYILMQFLLTQKKA